jgi:hypothetical protein
LIDLHTLKYGILQPWPLIAAITRYMQNDDPNEYYGDITVDDGRSSSAGARGATGSAPSTSSGSSSTITSMANVAATAAARLLKRADDEGGRSTWTDKDLGYGGYAGNGYMEDSYTPQMRWTAVGVLLGVLVAAWLPWIYVSVRVSPSISRFGDTILTLSQEQSWYYSTSKRMERS